ncbi:alpha/beta fold hydrolase [Actinomycetes bacterium KLBMP 9759]
MAADVAASTERTIDNVLGQQVMGDFRPSDLIDTARSLAGDAVRHPTVVARSVLGFVSEIGLVAAGERHREPARGDRRFTDAQWRENPIYAGLLQGYLAMRESMDRYAVRAGGTDRQAERIRFLMTQVGDALAPTNFLLGNPAALRKARETRGLSLLRGARNALGDVRSGRPIPAQVDGSAFEVGRNLACTPGSVVLRTEMFELIQYAPQTTEVHERPIVIVPSIVNKFYVFDLAPGRSVIEHYVRSGFTVYCIGWRNPQPRHDRWGMQEYRDAIDTALDTASEISACDTVNMWAVCGAGPVAVSLAAHHAATGEKKINSLLLVVSPLDTEAMADAPSIGAFMDKDDPAAPERVADALRNKRMSAKEFTLLFAMLRANDLIWNYWVSNYLMGDRPPAFDVLYWNEDATGMTARFNSDFSEFVHANPFVTPGAMQVRGTPIADVSDLGFDSYVLGAKNDHLCVWQSVYRSAQVLGPRSTFVLGNSGHIQTIVCPPANPKASFSTGADLTGTADEWLESSERHRGSWWDHGVAWTRERSGRTVPAPETAGSSGFPALGPAPGRYVMERA